MTQIRASSAPPLCAREPRRLIVVMIALAGTLALAGAATRSNASAVAPVRQAVTPLGSFETALMDPEVFAGPNLELGLARTRAAGARAVRLILNWRASAPDPGSARRPPNFDAADPAHPAYKWLDFDRQVASAAARGLQPIVTIFSAPRWAEGSGAGDPGTREPEPREFALFATAAARRYGGAFGSLPRVRYWQAWNEPNLNLFLNPQSPALYRRMVNEFTAAVKRVHRDNLVIAGGLAPFGFPGVAVGPLEFMRDLLCVSRNLRRTCRNTVRFDIWAHHPYTQGGPAHKAARRDDASLGDLQGMRRLLDAAVRARTISSSGRVRFWVTEFSWDSSPPDPDAVPTALHTRWVAEAMYRMWRSGVSLVTWYSLRDDPLSKSQFQSGLYYLDSEPAFALARAKPALRAFRFPFVAFRQGKNVYFWGRAPRSSPTPVTVEQRVGPRWKRVASLRTGGSGVFANTVRSLAAGPLRARAHGDASVPFDLRRTPDMSIWPFGCGGVLVCSKASP